MPVHSGAEVRALFWEQLENGRIACRLCPHECSLLPGKTGLCKVRRNEDGELALPHYGCISSMALDPIEKKPLYHFLPGSSVFSVGFLGCNLRCPFCQNWEISQTVATPARPTKPEELVAEALHSGSPSIAYTYSEPIVHIEFVLESMRLARAAGLRNVLVTNGCATEEAARALLERADAVNVDLKCWSASAYRDVLGGDIDAVRFFIARAADTCHLEVTTLVVPGLNDTREEIESIAGFIAGLSADIALHLSAYHPAWKHRAPATSPEALRDLAEIALSRLRYVYVGNLVGEAADTRCPACGATVLRRRGFSTSAAGLSRDRGGRMGRCSACGAGLPIIVS